MKILFFGDTYRNCGPSIVNRNLLKECSNDVIHFQEIKKNGFKNSVKIFNQCDIITISGINFGMAFILSILAKITNKKIVYICHGLVKIEKDFRKIDFLSKMLEKYYYSISDKIICVSNNFSDVAKNSYARSSNKIEYINNGVEVNETLEIVNKKKDKLIKILALGGGRPEKDNISICKAIKKIEDKDIQLIIIGEDGRDTESIKEYSFVKYLGMLSHNEVLEQMKNSDLYIQASKYEPFGMAPLEALINGCSIICSDQIGMISIIDIEKTRYVFNVGNIDELELLIKNTLEEPNNDEIFNNINFDKLKWSYVVKQYYKMWGKLLN